jgi:hypothetical protein
MALMVIAGTPALKYVDKLFIKLASFEQCMNGRSLPQLLIFRTQNYQAYKAAVMTIYSTPNDYSHPLKIKQKATIE